MAATKGGKVRKISSNRGSGIVKATKFGGTVSDYSGKGVGIVAGVKDTVSGRIFKKPRPVVNSGIKAGGAVKITNPDNLPSRLARKHGGIGVGVGDPKS